MSRDELMALAGRVARVRRCRNDLDILVEIALFKPSNRWASVRPNDAGTKVIFTDTGGSEWTYRPDDWTMTDRRKETAAALRAIAAQVPA